MNDDEQERLRRLEHWRVLAEQLGLPPGPEPQPSTPPPAPAAPAAEAEEEPENVPSRIFLRKHPPEPAFEMEDEPAPKSIHLRHEPDEEPEDLGPTEPEAEPEATPRLADLPEADSKESVEEGLGEDALPSGDDDDSRRRGGRRRGRRGRKGPPRREAPATEDVPAARLEAMPAADLGRDAEAAAEPAVEETGEEEPQRRGRGRGRSRQRERKPPETAPAPVEDQEVEAELDSADEDLDAGDDEPDTLSDWNVPSWNELIASLYRPPDR
jgi:hypothetical protein